MSSQNFYKTDLIKEPITSVTSRDFQSRNLEKNSTFQDDDDDDSDSSLELAQTKEASRIKLTIPSILKREEQAQKMAAKKAASEGRPFQCQEIGPQLDLGYQWPKENKVSQGFVKDKSLLQSTTVNIKETFNNHNPGFIFDHSQIPKRVLTKPGKPCRNEGNDNEDWNYILKVNEILGHDPNYQVIDLLGQGTFGQVVKCERISTGELFSVKVIKNKSAYKTQSCMEIEILKKLNKQWDPEDKHHILRIHHIFSHKQHLCLVFELLSYNLYDLMTHNHYRGFSPEKVRAFAVQILDTLGLLKEAKIIHCDLKPENILLTSEKSMTIKVIDFGSSCHEANKIFTYIQSRFYRAPEVLLGLRYTASIDMWSFGCVVAELFLGLPIFPGVSEYNQLFRIIEMLGVPPKDMLSIGKNTHVYFNKKMTGQDTFEYEMKSRDQYCREENRNEMSGRIYHSKKQLKQVIMDHNHGKPIVSKEEQYKRKTYGPLHPSQEEQEQKKEYDMRLCLLDFLYGVLEINPLKRWTPQQALQHPFITQKPFKGPFQPDTHLPTPSFTSQVRNSPSINTRKRSESMNKPNAPEQIKMLAQEIQYHPIAKYPKEQAAGPKMTSDYRQQYSRSQGDYVGMMPPDMPRKGKLQTKEEEGPKVKIDTRVKVRKGSHDSLHEHHQTKSINVRKAHAGEAAGGLLMMRQESFLQKKENTKIASKFKRRSLW
ncbi:dual specificity protein kinase yak1 [Rhizopus stolonifer]|uniref:Dual specificity protein kinase yak1 n=1 Tax=Rhizopus stolonifer TaxID=4846 RepID=A0A367J903_RHIST|nr:dual specificity protein kinase yak1 [Rhizopus stolonifer]